MLHLLAEAAEMRCEEEVAVDRCDGAERSAVEKAPDAADRRQVAAVLHDGVDDARRLRRLDDAAPVREVGGERLFGEHMASRANGRRDDIDARFRHGHVEDCIGSRRWR